MDRELRKYQSSLMVSGMGVILFGAWNIVKATLTCLYGLDLSWSASQAVGNVGTAIIAVVAAVAALLPDLAMRLYVGISARAEAMGVGRSRKYVAVAWVLLVAIIVALAFELFIIYWMLVHPEIADFNILVVMLVDLTSLSALIELLVSARRVKKLGG